MSIFSSVPILLFLAVLAGLFLRYVYLRLLLRKTAGDWEACYEALLVLGTEFVRYAQAHQGRLPDALETVLNVVPAPENACGYTYRFVPELGQDERLILAYDNYPRHGLMHFPRLTPGRNVLFASGRVELFAEEAVEQLIVGDNVLRGRLNLPEIPMGGEGDHG